jgi:monoamine oxidase
MPPGGHPGAPVGFLEGADARRLGAVPAHERRDAVLGSLARLFGMRAEDPADYPEQDWAVEPWSRASP